MLNIIQLYNDYNIDYTTYGKNTTEGWVNTTCVNPFCNDFSNHLGYNIESNYFYCWKCGYHSTYQILSWLLPNENVDHLMFQYSVRGLILSNLKKSEQYKKPDSIKLPGKKLLRRHRQYLRSRNFDPDYLIEKYRILGTDYFGDYKNRIIVPIYFKEQLVGYQGRDITGKYARYKHCKKEDMVVNMHDILYNYDECKDNWVIVTEGIFKVWRLGKNVVATFGKNYSSSQVNLLNKFKTVFVFFDPDIPGQKEAKKLVKDLDCVGIEEVYNIVNDKAPDDMNEKEVENFYKKIM